MPGFLFAYAASAVLIASFVALGALWHEPRLEGAPAEPFAGVPRAVDVIGGGVGVAVFALLVYAGFAGTPTPTQNLTPTVVYVLFWVALVPLSVVAGDVFALLNPWRAVARGVGWAVERLGGDRLAPPLPYPNALGRWPAAIGIAAFAWLELVYLDRDVPSTIAMLALVYAVVQLVGMTLFGVEPWRRRGDAFSAYFGLFARMSPLVREGRRLCRRKPLSGLTTLEALPGTVALVCLMIGSTSFDGLSGTVGWSELAPHIGSFFSRLGAGPAAAVELTGTFGLVLMVGIVAGVYTIGIRGMRYVDESRSALELARAFAHTLVPIACGYVVAHYFSFLVFQGQGVVPLVSDPLGRGDDVLGTAGSRIDYGLVSKATVWYVQVGALVIGHVASLVLAHDRALKLFSSARAAARSQRWILTVMVGYTSLGLWLLASAKR